MKKILRLLALVAGGLVLLAAAIAVAVALLVDPNDFKGTLEARVRAATGRELRIEGPISLSFFPWLGLSLGPTELGNLPGFPTPVLARLEHTRIRVRLLPLLFEQRLEMDTVTVRGLSLNLARDAAGRTDWAGLVPAGAGQAPGLPGALAVGGVQIQGATIRWDDAVSGSHLVLDRLDLGTGKLLPGEPTAVHLAFDLSAREPRVTGRVEADARVQPDPGAQRWSARDLHASVALQGTSLPGGRLRLSLAADVSCDLAAHTVAATRLRLDVPRITAGALQADVNLQGRAGVDLDKQALALQQMRIGVELSGAPLSGGPLAVEGGADVLVDLGTRSATVSALRVQAEQLHASGGFRVSGLLSRPEVTGELRVVAFDPHGLLGRLGFSVPATADPNALRSVSFDAAVNGGPEMLRLDPLKLGVDGATIDGMLLFARGAGGAGPAAGPSVRFDLSAGTLDLDRYLPPSSGAPAAAAGALPLDALRALDLGGRLRVSALVLAGIHMSDVELRVKSQDGRVQVLAGGGVRAGADGGVGSNGE